MGILKREWASHRLARTASLLLCRRGDPWVARKYAAKNNAHFFNYLIGLTEKKLPKQLKLCVGEPAGRVDTDRRSPSPNTEFQSVFA